MPTWKILWVDVDHLHCVIRWGSKKRNYVTHLTSYTHTPSMEPNIFSHSSRTHIPMRGEIVHHQKTYVQFPKTHRRTKLMSSSPKTLTTIRRFLLVSILNDSFIDRSPSHDTSRTYSVSVWRNKQKQSISIMVWAVYIIKMATYVPAQQMREKQNNCKMRKRGREAKK